MRVSLLFWTFIKRVPCQSFWVCCFAILLFPQHAWSQSSQKHRISLQKSPEQLLFSVSPLVSKTFLTYPLKRPSRWVLEISSVRGRFRLSPLQTIPLKLSDKTLIGQVQHTIVRQYSHFIHRYVFFLNVPIDLKLKLQKGVLLLRFTRGQGEEVQVPGGMLAATRRKEQVSNGVAAAQLKAKAEKEKALRLQRKQRIIKETDDFVAKQEEATWNLLQGTATESKEKVTVWTAGAKATTFFKQVGAIFRNSLSSALQGIWRQVDSSSPELSPDNDAIPLGTIKRWQAQSISSLEEHFQRSRQKRQEKYEDLIGHFDSMEASAWKNLTPKQPSIHSRKGLEQVAREGEPWFVAISSGVAGRFENRSPTSNKGWSAKQAASFSPEGLGGWVEGSRKVLEKAHAKELAKHRAVALAAEKQRALQEKERRLREQREKEAIAKRTLAAKLKREKEARELQKRLKEQKQASAEKARREQAAREHQKRLEEQKQAARERQKRLEEQKRRAIAEQNRRQQEERDRLKRLEVQKKRMLAEKARQEEQKRALAAKAAEAAKARKAKKARYARKVAALGIQRRAALKERRQGRLLQQLSQKEAGMWRRISALGKADVAFERLSTNRFHQALVREKQVMVSSMQKQCKKILAMTGYTQRRIANRWESRRRRVWLKTLVRSQKRLKTFRRKDNRKRTNFWFQQQRYFSLVNRRLSQNPKGFRRGTVRSRSVGSTYKRTGPPPTLMDTFDELIPKK